MPGIEITHFEVYSFNGYKTKLNRITSRNIHVLMIGKKLIIILFVPKKNNTRVLFQNIGNYPCPRRKIFKKYLYLHSNQDP